MSAMTAELVELLSHESGRNRVRTAKLARVADDGTVFVAIDKDREVAVRVLTTLHVDELVSGVEMLLLQDEDPSAMPIVVGVVADKVSRMLPVESGRWE